jgi:hypothetical protein
MAIKINQSLFLPQIKQYGETLVKEYEDNSVDLGRETLDVAEGWFQEQPWQSGNREDFDTQRECRIELKRYVLSKIKLDDANKSWYDHSFTWSWVSNKVVTYVVKILIEHYWDDLMDEMGLGV